MQWICASTPARRSFPTLAAMAAGRRAAGRRPTSTRCARTPRARRGASTSPATRAAPRRTRCWPRRSGSERWRSTSRRSRRASTPARSRRRSSARRSLPREAWGAARTWFLINGASQGNHAACVALAQGGERGGRAAQRPLEHDRRARRVRPAARLRGPGDRPGARHRALRHAGGARSRARRDARARSERWSCRPPTSARSPTCSGLARVAHEHGVPLVVDEAWGAHLAFGPSLPRHALACGADLVVSSTHKIIGSFTQSAMLHLGRRRAARRARRGPRDHACSSRPARARCCAARSTRRALRGRAAARACSRRRCARSRAARQAIRAHPGPRRAGRAVSPSGRACTPTTRCGSSSTCGARA